MVELDKLLFSDDCTMQEVREFFRDGEFYAENYLVMAIKKYLLSDEDRQFLNTSGLSIEDCLNGRYNGEQETEVTLMYHRWNVILGFNSFKF